MTKAERIRRNGEGLATLGSLKSLGIDRPEQLTAESICPICGDTASKRRVQNPCVCETHRAYLR